MIIHEKTIMWDWNGTLLDDAETCMDTMNQMLSRREMPLLNLELYKEVFGFPVIDYYQKIGFDFSRESFENLSVEFIDAYNQALALANLVENAYEVLEFFKNTGKNNIIVSAMKHDMLLQSVKDNGLEGFFSEILGLDNIYAASKSHMALEYVRDNAIRVEDIVFIGDTEHDFEVAREIGCRCILVADGHQSEERLLATGAEVITSLKKLLDTIVPKSF